jgi:hypothetical protein
MAKPDMTFEAGSCKASVFQNKVEREGKEVIIPKVSVSKRYLDKSGEWKNTQSFGVNDLPKLMVVVMKSYEFLTSRRKGGNGKSDNV